MKHPDQIQLAMFAGGDLGWAQRWLVHRHLGRCSGCAQDVVALQAGRVELRQAAGAMPDGISWQRLTQEMTGNIRVGLAAGECIAQFEKGSRGTGSRKNLAWNAAVVLACATLVAVAALWIELPRQQIDHLTASLQKIRINRIGQLVRSGATAEAGAVIEASPLSIGITENGGSLSLLHPRSNGVAVSVSMQGSAGARYIDTDTGQVTTTRVYYAQ